MIISKEGSDRFTNMKYFKMHKILYGNYGKNVNVHVFTRILIRLTYLNILRQFTCLQNLIASQLHDIDHIWLISNLSDSAKQLILHD